MLTAQLNPNRRPNSDVVKRRVIGRDIVQRDQRGWLVDFGDMTEADAALYELPFEFVRTHVKPLRDNNRDRLMHQNWWLHGRTRPALRAALARLRRYIVTPEVAKHRIFVWMSTDIVPDHTCHVMTRDDDYFFGVVHSRTHEVWSLSQGAWIGKGNDPRYSSARTFETFPFPWPPGHGAATLSVGGGHRGRPRASWWRSETHSSIPLAHQRRNSRSAPLRIYIMRALSGWQTRIVSWRMRPSSPPTGGPQHSPMRRFWSACSP